MDERTKELAREIFIRTIAQALGTRPNGVQVTDFPGDADMCFQAAKAFLEASDKAP